MSELRQLAADSFAEITMAEQITRLQLGAPSIAAVLAAIQALNRSSGLKELLNKPVALL